MPQFQGSSDKTQAYGQAMKAPHKTVRSLERLTGVDTKHATTRRHIYARAKEVQYECNGTWVKRSRATIETTSICREKTNLQVDCRLADKDKAATKYQYGADKNKTTANRYREPHPTDKDEVAANHQNKANKYNAAAKPHDKAATYRRDESRTATKGKDKAAAKPYGKPRAADKDKAAAKYQKEADKDKAAAHRYHEPHPADKNKPVAKHRGEQAQRETRVWVIISA